MVRDRHQRAATHPEPQITRGCCARVVIDPTDADPCVKRLELRKTSVRGRGSSSVDDHDFQFNTVAIGKNALDAAPNRFQVLVRLDSDHYGEAAGVSLRQSMHHLAHG